LILNFDVIQFVSTGIITIVKPKREMCEIWCNKSIKLWLLGSFNCLFLFASYFPVSSSVCVFLLTVYFAYNFFCDGAFNTDQVCTNIK
jgi:hypothetical protein